MLTDFHSHILPGIDDGSRSIEQSLAMLAMAAEQGVDQVIATPHFYARHDDPERFLARRTSAAEDLFRVTEGKIGFPAIKLGAEVRFFNGISECDSLSRLTIDKKHCILIEMPEVFWTEKMYRELEGIYTKQGLTPIIAHIDRYVRPLTCHKVLRELEQLPVLVQANAGWFLEPVTARLALRLLRQEQIHLLGSDCHNLSDRAPNLGSAAAVIREKLGNVSLERIAGYQQKVLE